MVSGVGWEQPIRPYQCYWNQVVWETRLHPAPLTTAPPPITELRLRRFGLYQDLAPATLDRTMKSGNDATFWRNPNSRIFAKYEIAVECSHLSNFQNTFNRYIYQMLQKISNTHHPSDSKYCQWKTLFHQRLQKKLFFINACKKYDVFIEVKSSVILLGLVWLQSRCFPP